MDILLNNHVNRKDAWRYVGSGGYVSWNGRITSRVWRQQKESFRKQPYVKLIQITELHQPLLPSCGITSTACIYGGDTFMGHCDTGLWRKHMDRSAHDTLTSVCCGTMSLTTAELSHNGEMWLVHRAYKSSPSEKLLRAKLCPVKAASLKSFYSGKQTLMMYVLTHKGFRNITAFIFLSKSSSWL